MAESPTTAAQRPDTRDMVVLHRVFRREFRLMPGIVRAVAAGATERAAFLAHHADELMGALHHHDTGEDELLWPRLRERAPMSHDLVTRMERQHMRIADLLATVEPLVQTWALTADPETRDRMAGLLDEVSACLAEHLALEERDILPVVEGHLTVEEWQELGARGMASIPRDRLPVFLGYMLEDATDEERRVILGTLPAPARLAYRLVGRRRWAREVAAVRAGVSVPAQRLP